MTDQTGNTPLFLGGSDNAISNIHSYLSGNPLRTNQLAFLRGGFTVANNLKHGYTRGSLSDVSSQGNYLFGNIAYTSSTSAFLQSVARPESTPFTTSGTDLKFDIVSFPDGSQIIVETNLILASDQLYSQIIIYRSGGTYTYYLYDGPTLLDAITSTIVPDNVRILVHGIFITIYIDEYWLYTFYPKGITYAETTTILLKNGIGGAPQLANITRRELSDWRDAIWIDLETSAQNAISSIIQQRPVEIYGKSDGSIVFVYDRNNRDTITLDYVRRYSKALGSNSVASDSIVYYTDVKALADTSVARDVGFITRIIRVPELDSGALAAAKIMQKRARQSRKRYSLTSRINLAIEIGDIVEVDAAITGTGTAVNFTIIVENISFEIRDGFQGMRIEGRDATN